MVQKRGVLQKPTWLYRELSLTQKLKGRIRNVRKGKVLYKLRLGKDVDVIDYVHTKRD